MNQHTPKRVARLTGEIYTHRLLWHTAQSLRDSATEDAETSPHELLGALLFVFFAFEAFLNYLGPLVVPEAWQDERRFFSRNEQYRGTLGKLHLLADRLAVSFDKGTRPYQTLRALNEKRDFLAHPRPELVDEHIPYTDPSNVPRSKEPELFGLADLSFLDRATADVESIGDSLQARAQVVLGEHVIYSPRAFVGMLWHQGGSL